MKFTPKQWLAGVAAIGVVSWWLRRHPAGAAASPSVEKLDEEFGYKKGAHGTSKHAMTPPQQELVHPVKTIKEVLQSPRIGPGEGAPHPPQPKTPATLPGTKADPGLLAGSPVTEPWERVPPPSGTSTRTAGDVVRTAATWERDDRDVLGMPITGHAAPGDAQLLTKTEQKAREVNTRR